MKGAAFSTALCLFGWVALMIVGWAGWVASDRGGVQTQTGPQLSVVIGPRPVPRADASSPCWDVEVMLKLPPPRKSLGDGAFTVPVDAVFEVTAWAGLEIAPGEPPRGDLPDDTIYQRHSEHLLSIRAPLPWSERARVLIPTVIAGDEAVERGVAVGRMSAKVELDEDGAGTAFDSTSLRLDLDAKVGPG